MGQDRFNAIMLLRVQKNFTNNLDLKISIKK